MINAVKCCDRVMFFNLLLLTIFLPYSAMVIQGSIFFMMISWVIKRTLMLKANPQLGFCSNYNFIPSDLKWPLLFIAAWILLTMPFALVPTLSLKKFFSRFLQYAFLVYAVKDVVNTPKRFFIVMGMLLWTLIVVNADAIYQYLSGASFIFSNHMFFKRVNGPLRHPNDLGTLLVSVAPILLTLLLTSRYWGGLFLKKNVTFVMMLATGALFFVSMISLGLTTSRGAWIAFILSMGGLVLFLKNYRLVLCAVVMMGLFFWVFGSHCVNIRLDIAPTNASGRSIAFEETTQPRQEYAKEVLLNSSGRASYWKAALDVLKQNPIIGCGYNNYIQAMRKLNLGHEEYPHNTILLIAAELGLVGLGLYLWLFYSIFMRGFRIIQGMDGSMKVVASGIYFGILAWFIHSQLDTPWNSLQLSFLWWFMIGVMLSLPAVYEKCKFIKEEN